MYTYSCNKSSILLEKFQKIRNIFKLIAMTVENHFILHVTNGIHITIHKLCYSIFTRNRIQIIGVLV